ncbi:flagellar motor switch protein FliG [Pseudoprimorskyibacter insulae]|uniref:Flagellar motor switch protein FliG n=1 Tax=Pseudoprimorskyibacter insulae TaxID=1695997 RepID=A0A2R8AXU0_9RHOB|nr:FliG C-terminal domain-containing protein [Pseudoprimorskyibacter insulae]SPF80865.1 Flagellar motor switch protein FliG [Pseudoprimorskyibacter insulae]
MEHLHSLAALPAPAAAPATRKPLSRKAKAAIVVQFLLNEGAEIPLTTLPDDLQAELTFQMGAMRYVDRDTLNAVIAEFTAELEAVGLRFPGGMAGALHALDGKISPKTARRLRKEAGVRQAGDPWVRIGGLPQEKLLHFASAESIEVAAVMVSKLDVAKAAQLLGQLPGERARRITYAMSLTGNITPDAVDRIGLSLAAQLDAEPSRAFDAAPVQRLGAILNFSNTDTREDVLTGLDESDAEFADAVRRAIFTFANIPDRLRPQDAPKITRDVDQADIVNAFAGAATPEEQAAVEFLLRNMSKRMAQTLQDEVADRGKVRPRDAEAGMSAIVAAIRDMEKSGEIELKQTDEDE